MILHRNRMRESMKSIKAVHKEMHLNADNSGTRMVVFFKPLQVYCGPLDHCEMEMENRRHM